MPFKIIRTVEKGKPQLCVVPESWEDKGVLKWPKKTADLKLIRLENSVPKPDWTKIVCTVKRRHLLTYDLANQELQLMINQTDTEHEDEVVRRQPALLQDFNNFTEQLVINQDSGGSANLPTIASEAQSTDTYYVLDSMETPAITLPDRYSETKTILQNQTIMFSIMNQVVDNQKKIIQKLASLSVQIEESWTNTEVTTLQAASMSSDNTSLSIKRITKIEDLEDFEKLLSDADYKNKLVKSCSIICNGGLGDATNCAYRFLDVLFSREFFCQCSWSGGARGDGVKISMKCFKRTLSFFFHMIKQWDSSYTIEANEAFFKNVLRNANKRKNVTYQRCPTKRRRSSKDKAVKKQKTNVEADISSQNFNKNDKCENNQAENENKELQNHEIEQEIIAVLNTEKSAKNEKNNNGANFIRENIEESEECENNQTETEKDGLQYKESVKEIITALNGKEPTKKNNNDKTAQLQKNNDKDYYDIMPQTNEAVNKEEEINNLQIGHVNVERNQVKVGDDEENLFPMDKKLNMIDVQNPDQNYKDKIFLNKGIDQKRARKSGNVKSLYRNPFAKM